MTNGPTIGKRIFAWVMRSGDSINRKLYSSFKNDLFRNLRGTVLDVGAGTGLNMAFAPSTVSKWIAAEPNVAFHADINKEATEHSFIVEVSSMDAHKLELPDNSIDGVVSTLVLCSVENQELVLSEIYRVLKPGSLFVFIEHVASDKRSLRIAQDVFNPLNRILADGCNCNRDTLSAIEASSLDIIRFESIELKGLTLFHKPHIVGFATKPTN